MNVHSCILAPHLKETLSAGVGGKYGRMFPDLPLHDADEAALFGLGRAGAALDAGLVTDHEGRYSDNPRISAGFTYFGQLIAHDITADRSLLQHHASVSALRNFRTPSLDLESVYAAGPSGTPYSFDMLDPDKFLLGLNDPGRPDDLPRNHQGRALIGDPRDDVHLVISQMHLLLPKFHNRVVDWCYFLHTDAEHPRQPGKRIHTLLVHPLIDLPEAVVGAVEIPEHRSLAVRDLQRARALDMPSGEEVAQAMGAKPLTPEECGLVNTGWTGETPLWYDVLKEAEVHTDGQYLGLVGGRIVAEELIGLIAADAESYLGADPEWRPVLPAAQSGCFTMADLIGTTYCVSRNT